MRRKKKNVNPNEGFCPEPGPVVPGNEQTNAVNSEENRYTSEDPKHKEENVNSSQPIIGNPDDGQPYGENPGYDQPYGEPPGYGQSYGENPGYDQPYGETPGYGQSYGENPGYDQPYGETPDYGQAYGENPGYDQPYGETPDDGRPYIGNPDEGYPYGENPGCGQAYDENQGNIPPYGLDPGYDPAYGGDFGNFQSQEGAAYGAPYYGEEVYGESFAGYLEDGDILEEDSEDPPPRKPSRGRRILRGVRRTFAVFLTLILVGALGFSVFYLICASRAPKLDILDVQPQYYRSTVLDTKGDIVLTLSGQESNRVYVKLSEIPVNIQRAFVAIEDERFYQHHGVDFLGIGRALVKGITSGSFSQGASTITQQLIKNNVLTGWTEEKTFLDKIERKIQEQSMAWSLERKVDKNWILENYLNTINLGGGNWGVETAAKYYFDKDVSELTLSESAALAAIPKNPTTFNPLSHPEENEWRRKLVLEKMLELGYINEAQRDEALADPVYERIATVSSGERSQKTFTYFEDAMVTAIISDLRERLGMTEEEAWDKLYRGGLTIESTEDARLQDICQKIAARDDLIPGDSQISLVLMDNATGQIRAMIGGRGKKEGSLLFNRAISSVRQPGSTIKIIGEYAAGLEDGVITLGTTVDDAPSTYSNGDKIVNSDGRYLGMSTVHSAIVRSGNIIALKCFQKEGMENVAESLKRFGISTLCDEDMVEALALGGMYGGVTNLEMTAAYSTLARGGEYREPIYYTRILNPDGSVLLEKEQTSWQAVSANTSALLTAAMEDVVDGGTGMEARLTDMSAAGKSGTTSQIRDAWFIGYTPYLTCGVWGGNDDNSGQSDSSYAKVLWREIMQEAHTGLSDKDFNGEGRLVKVKICAKCGKIAVEGLCDQTVQGNMIVEEYFVPGTQPKETCDCHVKVEICAHTHQKAAVHEEDEWVWSFFTGWRTNGEKGEVLCPSTYTRVYLKSATEGTEDAPYVLPESYGENGQMCLLHSYRATPTPTMTPTPTLTPTPVPDLREERDEDDRPGFFDWLFGRDEPSQEELERQEEDERRAAEADDPEDDWYYDNNRRRGY